MRMCIFALSILGIVLQLQNSFLQLLWSSHLLSDAPCASPSVSNYLFAEALLIPLMTFHCAEDVI